MKRQQWTIEKLSLVVKQYTSRSELQRENNAAYKAAYKRGLLAILLPDTKIIYWTDDMLKIEAAQYKSRSDFAKGSPSAYVTARKRGLIDSICPKSQVQPVKSVTVEEKAKKYRSRTEFARKDPAAYSIAQRRGMLNALGLEKLGATSIPEKDLLEWLQTLSPDFVSKRFGVSYELDCYSEKLKLGVEYNGLYWHREDKVGKRYHLDKTKYFEAIGIRVIHIWAPEWENRKEQVKDFLRSACGLNSVILYARKCEFKSIPWAEAKVFLTSSHIQGAPNHSAYSIGCYHAGVLVGVSTFGRHHRGEDVMVLNRFACKADHTVCGFLSKATKMASAKLGPLVSWADYSKSQARGYISAGWQQVKLHNPDYFYSDKSGLRVISKQSRRKSAVSTPSGMTESEHSAKDGLYRVWDCGKILLTYKSS